MTYLLTEVALDILGQHYYNVDGVPGSPCLTGNTAISIQGDFSNKPHLEELMKIDLDNEAEINKGKLKENIKEDEILTSSSSNSSQSDGNKVPQDKRLSKLFSYERGKLREQIRRRKSQYLSKLSQTDANAGELLSAFINENRQRLKEELHVLIEFRKNTETAVMALDGEIYKKYINTFKKGQIHLPDSTILPDELAME